ncbi:hypothetical protein [Tenacibaculum sp. IB213877]|uniref:hypothetical protein n=1 Tax=Tenacibaculum sp. IB213877 TaxID=3097351 RepID=UPI002A5A893B|nr:hypothetical protein [Tenacibaculum sp. IB213877]MDY0780854.1 hypothetical protein [Tenacibaculum sp. IB213877]
MKYVLTLFIVIGSLSAYSQGASQNAKKNKQITIEVADDNLVYQTNKGEGIYRLSTPERNFITNTATGIDNNPNSAALSKGKAKFKFQGKKYGINEFAKGVPFQGVKNLLISLEILE